MIANSILGMGVVVVCAGVIMVAHVIISMRVGRTRALFVWVGVHGHDIVWSKEV
jgi:hypothetical protein